MLRVGLEENNGRVIELAEPRVKLKLVAVASTLISYMLVSALTYYEVIWSRLGYIPYAIVVYMVMIYFIYNTCKIVNDRALPSRLTIVDNKLLFKLFRSDIDLDLVELFVDDGLSDKEKHKIVEGYNTEDPVLVYIKWDGKTITLVADKDQLKNLEISPKNIP